MMAFVPTTALIIGATGFMGTHLARRLNAEDGVRSIGVARHEPTDGSPSDEFVACDVTEAGSLNSLIRSAKPTWLFVLSGAREGDAVAEYRTNVLGLVHVCEAVRTYAEHARILVVGSAAEYGCVRPDELPVTEGHGCRPIDNYGAAKLAATGIGLHYAFSFGIRAVVARPFNVIGSGMSDDVLAGTVVSQLRERPQGPVRLGDLDDSRDYVAVEDVVDAYVRMVAGDHSGQVFNLCSGKPVSSRFVVESLLSFSTQTVTIEHSGRPPGKGPRVVYGSYRKAQRAFGFMPRTTLVEALKSAWSGKLN